MDSNTVDSLWATSLMPAAQHIFKRFEGDNTRINDFLATEVPFQLRYPLKEFIGYLRKGDGATDQDKYDLLTMFHLFQALYSDLDADTILECAAGRGHGDVIRKALDLGATDLNSALSKAAANGQREVVRIIAREATSHTGERPTSYNFNEALEYAAENGHREIVGDLIALGANDFNGAILKAVFGGHRDLVNYLVAQGRDAGASLDLEEPLEYAAQDGNLDIVRDLIAAGAMELNRALNRAAEYGRLEVVRGLIAAGANELDEAMLYAIEHDRIAIVIELVREIKTQAEADGVGVDLSGALDVAAANGRRGIVEMLIPEIVASQDEDGEAAVNFSTAMARAAENGHLQIVNDLIQAGATLKTL